MKELARVMARRGIKPRGRKPSPTESPPPAKPGRRLVDAFQEVPVGEENNPQSVFTVPDSWEKPKSIQGDPPTLSEPQAMKKLGPKKKPQHKRRRQSVSICVSEEEDFILRKHAYDKGVTFSEWARTVLFKAAGRKVPDRP
jgi:hypothetical protein